MDRDLWRLASVVVLGTIMSILDTTIVNVALETLGRDLDASLNVDPMGLDRLPAGAGDRDPADRLGDGALRRQARCGCSSVTLFLCGSTLCGLAWSTSSLIVFRVLQGFGGGMILPIGQAILAQAAGPQRMGRVMSVIGVPTLLGPILGPVIGGLIVDHFSWRWIFFVNLPIGAVALALAARILPSAERDTRSHAGHRRPAAALAGLALLVYGLSEFGTRAGSGADGGRPLVGGALLSGFVLHARRATTR